MTLHHSRVNDVVMILDHYFHPSVAVAAEVAFSFALLKTFDEPNFVFVKPHTFLHTPLAHSFSEPFSKTVKQKHRCLHWCLVPLKEMLENKSPLKWILTCMASFGHQQLE